MKIAFFSDSFLPQTNGVVTSILNMVKGLAERGHKILVIAPAYADGKEFTFPGVDVIRLNSLPALFYPEFKITAPINPLLTFRLGTSGVDIIHFLTPFTVASQGILAAKSLRVPLVGTFHTFFADPAYLKHGNLDNPLFEGLAWNYIRIFYDTCHLITCPAEYTRHELLRNGCRKPVKIISNGIDTSVFDNRQASAVKQKYNPGGKLLLYVGRIAHEKSIEDLIYIFEIVENRVPGTKLLIVGDGPQKEPIQNLLKTKNLEHKIHLCGRIEHQELISSGIYGACDLFITASRTENQPMTILEAQANGLACVAFAAMGIPELITDGENGYLINSGDITAFAEKVIRLLQDQTLLAEFRKRTGESIRRHELSNVITQWETTYLKLVGG